MSAQSMIEQLLKSGLSSLGGGASSGGSHLGKYAAGGVLGLLLGSKRGRSMGGTALKYGSIAAIGALAWRAYGEYQARQAGAAAAAPAPAVPQPAVPAFASLPAPQAEQHSRVLLKAMIAAARADGHFDDRERELVEAELQRQEADPALRQWFESELRRPVEPAEVAAGAGSPEVAAEIYLASLLVADTTTTMERAYLDELARQLKLPAALKADLETRAAAG
jgi:uncharacterized membrane protein YebE (DUF533 family)